MSEPEDIIIFKNLKVSESEGVRTFKILNVSEAESVRIDQNRIVSEFFITGSCQTILSLHSVRNSDVIRLWLILTFYRSKYSDTFRFLKIMISSGSDTFNF